MGPDSKPPRLESPFECEITDRRSLLDQVGNIITDTGGQLRASPLGIANRLVQFAIVTLAADDSLHPSVREHGLPLGARAPSLSPSKVMTG